MGRILSLDYGLKRIGVAVTDPMKIIATGLDTVDSHEIYSFLEDYFKIEEVDHIVIGYPLGLDGKATDSTKAVKNFKTRLSKRFPDLSISFEDERFTSKMASRAISESGMNRKNRQKKETIDKVSAVIILQSYMERI